MAISVNNFTRDFPEENLNFSHKFLLEEPYHLTCISKTLLQVLDYTEDEIIDQFDNQYVPMVHPEDRKRYLQFLRHLAESEQTIALHYRMIKKDGSTVYINDISFSHKKKNGKMYGFSMIADLTDSIEYHSAYSMFNLPSSIIPFGYIQCSCEKYPKILYINDKMLEYLNAPKNGREWQIFLKDNIYFMIPYEDRDTFRKYLSDALINPEPIKIKHQIIRSTGERSTLRGWLSTIINHDGEKEYSIVYTDKDDSNLSNNDITNNSYFKALENAYNIIFEVNIPLNTVECIYGKDTSDLGKLYDAHMTVKSAINFWVNNYIVEDDKDYMRDYFTKISSGAVNLAEHPLQAEFRIKWDDNKIYFFIGVAVQLDSTSIIFCCRDTEKVEYSSFHSKKISVSKKLSDFIDNYFVKKNNATSAIIFEKDNDTHCTLIYASNAIVKYFNWHQDQYIQYLEKSIPIDKLMVLSGMSDKSELSDLISGKNITLNLKDSDKTVNLSCRSLYENTYEILVTDSSTSENASGIPKTGIFARTFGYFDLFCNGTPVVFSSQKEKELMALLIDRNGGTLTSSEAISFLWEDEIPDEKTKARFRKLAMSLKRTLQQYGIEHILINHNGVRNLDTNSFICDYYELLKGNPKYIQSFHNSYMTEYTWSEHTLGILWDYS